MTLDDIEGFEVVPETFGEIVGHAGRVLFDDGRDEDGRTVEELVVYTVGIDVLRVLVPQWLENWCTIERGLMESGVDVVDETKTDVQCVLGSFRGELPAVKLLRNARVSVMLRKMGSVKYLLEALYLQVCDSRFS